MSQQAEAAASGTENAEATGAETENGSGEGITKIDVAFDDNAGGEGSADKKLEGESDKANPFELDYKGEKVVVPEAFRNEDGTVNVAAMARANDDLRRKLGTGEFGDSVPDDGKSYDLKLPEDLAEQGIEIANPEMMGKVEQLLRDCTIGGANAQKLFEGIARITGEQLIADTAASEEAHKTFIADQIKAVEPYASKADLDAFGTAAASYLTEDFKAGKFHSDPEKNKAHAMALHRGLMAMNGSSEAILAMNYLMKRVGGESAIPSIKDGGGSGGGGSIDEMRAEMASLQGSDGYISGDPKAVEKVQTLAAQIAKKRAEK